MRQGRNSFCHGRTNDAASIHVLGTVCHTAQSTASFKEPAKASAAPFGGRLTRAARSMVCRGDAFSGRCTLSQTKTHCGCGPLSMRSLHHRPCITSATSASWPDEHGPCPTAAWRVAASVLSGRDDGGEVGLAGGAADEEAIDVRHLAQLLASEATGGKGTKQSEPAEHKKSVPRRSARRCAQRWRDARQKWPTTAEAVPSCGSAPL